jgi:predicted Holliday junction resolvase-like endonuclease
VNVILITAAAVLLVIVGWLLVYKVRHPHTKEDLVKARKDSIIRSRSVVSGKVQEHLAPLFPEFISQFNPKDARFLGSPLDFVVFDGLDEGEVQRVVFV